MFLFFIALSGWQIERRVFLPDLLQQFDVLMLFGLQFAELLWKHQLHLLDLLEQKQNETSSGLGHLNGPMIWFQWLVMTGVIAGNSIIKNMEEMALNWLWTNLHVQKSVSFFVQILKVEWFRKQILADKAEDLHHPGQSSSPVLREIAPTPIKMGVSSVLNVFLWHFLDDGGHIVP